MFAFVLLWAYFSVSQLIIVWSGNLPEEIPFYLERFHGPWKPVSVAVLIGHFVVPFALLLSAPLKRTPSRVAVVALFILVMRVVETAWMIGPMVRHEGGSGLHWLDFAVSPRDGRHLAVRVLPESGRPRARSGARSVSQGRIGSWRTLNATRTRRPRRRRPRATASATAASSGSW